MAIVVNEFEVIPEESAARTPARTEAAQPSRKPQDTERESRRSLHERRARALRLMAV
jgi:hypothetical protein